MIICQIQDSARYCAISPALRTAIEWLMNHRTDQFVPGICTIGQSSAGTDITVKCEEPALLPREKARLEAHRRYIDIHVPLKGTESMGWAPTATLKHESAPYSEEHDIAFFGDSAQSLLHIKVGQMAIVFPEDAHAPNIGLGNHRKLCIKIPVG